LGGRAALLRGAPGSGKSDLALRFIHLAADILRASPELVADDCVTVERKGARLFASAPRASWGRLEVRGVGIVPIKAAVAPVELGLVVDLEDPAGVPRLPTAGETLLILDVPVPKAALDPFEASAAIKLALLLRHFPPAERDLSGPELGTPGI
jgi:serine kinase of HPr protein (carbohydrate metabolism regulator)